MRRYGVEIEFVSDLGLDEIADKLRQAGINAVAEGYNHSLRGYWKVITDSSCGYELVSPPLLGEEGIAEIITACNVLDQVGKVNKKCGVHVHIDAAGLTLNQIKSVIINYAENEAVFDLIMPGSRRGDNNYYCQSIARINQPKLRRCTSVQEILEEVFNNSRYYKVNIASYLRHGTIEFRQHSGSVDGQKISNWVRLIQSFVIRSIDAEIAANCDTLRARFEALIPANQPVAAPTKLTDIKKEVYRGLGLADSKSVKAWAKANGINADLRGKEGWLKIFNAVLTSASTVDLRSYYSQRTITLGTNDLVGVA
ncbi:MAG: amidoligase family protein [Brasilonema angustatum HA4187-MV1]|jgi:hypothetical protein|nr:amidoligase family protein [Brasilonema angustatum HA4187-MV1]